MLMLMLTGILSFWWVLPFPGHADAVVSVDVFKQFTEWANTYGPVFKIRLLNTPGVVVTDFNLAPEQLLKKPSPLYLPKQRKLYQPAAEVTTKPQMPNITSASDGPYWKAVRTAVAACFSTRQI